jgi:16S rRNA processing protein RimM
LALRNKIRIGRIIGLFGVKGWVKIYSYTQPYCNILTYTPWRIRLKGGWEQIILDSSRHHGHTLLAKLKGFDDRNQAAQLLEAEIAVDPGQLEPLSQNEYYWAELIGLHVLDFQGRELGVVDHLLETGGHDVLVLQGTSEILIPFVIGPIIKTVDVERGYLRVAWDPDY